MSFGFELDTRGQRELQSYMQQNMATPEQIDEGADPGMFAGTGGLFMSELAAAGRSVAIAGGAIPVVLDKVMGDDNLSGRSMADRYFEAVDDVTKSAVEYWKPSPAATGAAGRVLGPVAGGVVQLAATGGNPALMMLRQQVGTAVELVDQGVDATTAQMVGGAQGLATAVGFRLGTVGASLGAKMASGAAGNLATNVPAAAASQAVLESQGFTQQAKQFNPWDLEARAIDVLMGAAFGAVAHYGPKPAEAAPGDTPPPQTRLLPEERAALLTANAARNWDESAPGRPASDVDLAMHNNAMNTALEQMMRNEPVDVAAHIEGASFMPRADVPEIEAMRADILAQYDEFTRAETPPAPDVVIPHGMDDRRFQRAAYRGELEGMGRELVEGGGTDLGYGADGVHMGRVSSQNPDWFQNMPAETKLSVKAARVAIDKALNGKRLGKKEARFISAMMDNVQERREAYARELRANSGELRRQIVEARRQAKGEDAARDVPDYGFIHEEADYLPDVNAMERAISDMANEARAMGASWDEVLDLVDNKNTFDEMLQGFEQLRAKYENGQADAGAAAKRSDQGAADGMAKESTNAKEDPEIAAARAAIERQPEGAMIDLGDEDAPMIVDVRQAWKQIEQEMQQAKKQADGFMAAVTCFLGG